ncbi:hypothetical protein ARMSODRAFT_967147 [Armillaria solidipes]|uniref:Uncharacterized protein n=1 Tax=Armillaria solidipes TaxID=1076256 RepID=A0A2H3AJS7_9AGAR|nr:hypothetical protein ARMSODRAFT_967147 [Armillaria solidipes]
MCYAFESSLGGGRRPPPARIFSLHFIVIQTHNPNTRYTMKEDRQVNKAAHEQTGRLRRKGPRDIHNSSWRSGIPGKSNQVSNVKKRAQYAQQYSPTHRTEKTVQLQIEPAEPGKTDSITSRNMQVTYPKSAQ